MKTRSEYYRELELKYDGPIPPHLLDFCNGGAFPNEAKPSTSDVEKFCWWLRDRLEAKAGTGSHVSAQLEHSASRYTTGNIASEWTVWLHANFLGNGVVQFEGGLSETWERARSFVASDFNAASLTSPT